MCCCVTLSAIAIISYNCELTLNVLLCNSLSYTYRKGESHWWMKGSTPPQIAEIIIKLVKDMAAVSSMLLVCVFRGAH